MKRIQFGHTYEDIISLDNLLAAWGEFLKGKRRRKDVQAFERDLMSNIIALHRDLANRTYAHGVYEAFNVSDPKPRNIHKASVRDRLLHRALYRKLYPFFDRTFIHDSYSCRVSKATHKAIERFRLFAGRASNGHARTCWVLKCDIRKFFASIDHDALLSILDSYIPDQDIKKLLGAIIGGFHSTRQGVGLPLGNLTSQLLVNIYMNEFDQFAKHRLKAEFYIRYADDFVIFSHDHAWLEGLIPEIENFLEKKLKLALHPRKVSIRSLGSGVDFLGWVHFRDHRVLRATTKRRMMANVRRSRGSASTVQSYLGMLCHGNARKLMAEVNALAEDCRSHDKMVELPQWAKPIKPPSASKSTPN